jgi:DNA-binding NarL/FixJ family response regulator
MPAGVVVGLPSWCYLVGTETVPAAAVVVGRARELDLVRAFLAGLGSGARGLLLEGEAGIGKTSLVGAVCEQAAVAGWRLLACCGEQAEAGLSFVGLGDLVGGVFAEAAGVLPVPQRLALEAALARGSGAGRAPEARSVGLGLRSLLVELAAAQPLLVVVDDVQWLDRPTVRALAFVARRLQGQPVALMAAARLPLDEPDPLGLERALGDRLLRLRLGPLSLGALRLLVEGRLGYRYSRPLLVRLLEVSGGNPLFVLELARALGPEPPLEPGLPLPAPDSLRQLVAARLAALPPAGRQALLAAAMLAQPSEQLVEAASSPAGLEAVEEAGLARVEAGRVGFAHPLYAAAVYAAASTRKRRTLHQRLAGMVAEREERARHLALAAWPPEATVAAELEQAAAEARSRGALDAAGELLEQAHRYTPSDDPDAARRRCLAAAESYIHAGDRPRASLLLESLLESTPPGPLRAEALKLLAEIRYNEHDFGQVTQLLAQALEQTDDPALQVSLELTLAFVYARNYLDFASADRHARAGLAHAEQLREPALLAEALAAGVMLDFLSGRGIDWQTVERSLALEDPSRLLPLQMRPSTIAALLELQAGRLSEARSHLTALRRTASEAGDESDSAFLAYWQAWLELQAGDLAAAAAHADDGVAEAAITGSQVNQLVALAQRALVHAYRGDEDAARADAATVTEQAAESGFLPPLLLAGQALALVALALDQPQAAWETLEPLIQATDAHGTILGPEDLQQYLPLALEALIALGRHDRAQQLLDQHQPHARAFAHTRTLASLDRCQALLRAARGDLQAAQHALAQTQIPLETPFEQARTLLVQAHLHRRGRRRAAAREALQQALAIFEGIDARLWADHTRRQLAQLTSTPAGDELTAAERRVAQLAAAGQPNKQIAHTLQITINTVERHLTNAYRKLDVHNRTQLAARLSRQTDSAPRPSGGEPAG